jgi:hypothetical protein
MMQANPAGPLEVIRVFGPDLLAAPAIGEQADLANSASGAHVVFPRYAVRAAPGRSATIRAGLADRPTCRRVRRTGQGRGSGRVPGPLNGRAEHWGRARGDHPGWLPVVGRCAAARFDPPTRIAAISRP